MSTHHRTSTSVSTSPNRPRKPAHTTARLPCHASPPRVLAALADSGLFTPYIAYESAQEWSFAGGSLASVRLDTDGAELRTGKTPGTPPGAKTSPTPWNRCSHRSP
ncbi:hypothetical protein [Streptomyces daliensis]|uniref:Uncharacterized protein n=1 Tax=Streptomyces daliensis TaxID=299421 RepID=A0A8T4J5W6_9ACTN|nr:hypothetical protein [Streptomyces daliensis]